jgi:calcineurin-like phosphoesterase family protein
MPQPYSGYTWNIHGHLHDFPVEKYEPEIKAILDPHQILVALEHTHYQPLELKTILEKAGFLKNEVSNN